MSEYDMAAARDAAKLRALPVETLRALCAEKGYELRRKGVRREKRKEVDADGNEVKNTYFPHLAITATCYARTWKLLKASLQLWGCSDATVGRVWEERLLLGCEHIVRYLSREIGAAEFRAALDKLTRPLEKSEYIRNQKKKEAR